LHEGLGRPGCRLFADRPELGFMRLVSDLKGIGNLASAASVLLGAVSWKSASTGSLAAGLPDPGHDLSVLGMMLRWRSHRLEQKEKGTLRRAR